MEFYVITDLTPVWQWEHSVLYHRHQIIRHGKISSSNGFLLLFYDGKIPNTCHSLTDKTL